MHGGVLLMKKNSGQGIKSLNCSEIGKQLGVGGRGHIAIPLVKNLGFGSI